MKRTKLLGMISFIMFIAIAICALFSGCKPMNDKDAIAEPTEAPTVKPKPVANTPELTPTQEPTQAPTPEPTPCPTSEPVTEVPTPEPSYDANDIVLFSDQSFEDAFRRNYGFTDRNILMSDILAITKLEITSYGLKNIQDIALFKNLEELNLSNNWISDVSPLSGLTKLRVLDLSENDISDISSLEGLTNLRKLYIWDTSERESWGNRI